MARSCIPLWTCDRCGLKVEMKRNEHYDWGIIAARVNNGPFQIGSTTQNTYMDICNSCVRELKSWWERK